MNAPTRILVVDDDATNRLVLARPLEKAGYEVLTADDGFEAIESIGRDRPDLILLDVMMPERSGPEVCSILKADEETAAIPVIFVTAVSQTEQILKAFAAGGCDYVTKPVRSDELLARISVHLRLRQTEEELRHKNKELNDLAERLARTNAELANTSRIDALTGLLNRTTWDELLVKEHDRFLRYGYHYSVIMIDVDHFKGFNDARGHQAGDECLRRAARCIASSCRATDHAGRYGGEEFVILSPNTHREAAVKLAERTRKAIWALGTRHPHSQTADRLTISLGVATSAPGPWEDVLKRADDALYVAKRAGRNMVFADHRVLSPVDVKKAARQSGGPAAGSPDEVDDRATVLVVDDEPTNRAICRGCLERAGYKVREAADGRSALAEVEANPPDVIIMDVMMPDMDGLECTRRLKRDPDTSEIPVIVLSALAAREDVLAGLEAGADEYVGKPIRTNELVLRVRSMARLYRERADLIRSYAVRGEQVRILRRLVGFCRVVSISHDLDEVLEHTVSALAEVAQARRVSVMMPDDRKRQLSIRKSCGMDEELAETVRVPIGQPIAGLVFATGKPMVVNDQARVSASGQTYDSRFFASVPLLSAPLGGDGRPIMTN